MWGISLYLLIERAFDLDVGHDETVAFVEAQIAALEGPRLASPEESTATRAAG